jgi:hypothetical protein
MNSQGQLYPLASFPNIPTGFVMPDITKTVADDGDYLILFDSSTVPYKITKANFLAGLSSSGNNG